MMTWGIQSDIVYGVVDEQVRDKIVQGENGDV